MQKLLTGEVRVAVHQPWNDRQAGSRDLRLIRIRNREVSLTTNPLHAALAPHHRRALDLTHIVGAGLWPARVQPLDIGEDRHR